jgi:uncharacterized protein
MDCRTKTNLKALLERVPEIELVILVGSRATGEAGSGSDWDFAIQWTQDLEPVAMLAMTESLRRKLARALDVAESEIDLIDLPRSRLAMRALVAEQGLVLKGEDSLPWMRLLSRTWKELEDYQWERDHDAFVAKRLQVR